MPIGAWHAAVRAGGKAPAFRGRLEVELGQVIAEASHRFNVPGIAVALISGDDELTATTGVTSVENPLPVDADTLFKIASITKPVTGTALMKLVELGRLDFDAPLSVLSSRPSPRR